VRIEGGLQSCDAGTQKDALRPRGQLPTHGQKELGTGLVNKILKDLGLK
jgi:predicted RNA binding protein YcfA (HicA-like mRNA interferase family)